jgi:glycosyltransferase involved in cell wall biosynthesis
MLSQQLDVPARFIANTNADGVLSNLQSNSIFVLPGISEGMSNALLEAMAVGLAPVVSDTLANRAVITDDKNGLSYSADSAEDLASQLLRLLGNDELRNLLGVQARRTVEQRYTLTSVVDQYLALYVRMLGETDSMPIL